MDTSVLTEDLQRGLEEPPSPAEGIQAKTIHVLEKFGLIFAWIGIIIFFSLLPATASIFLSPSRICRPYLEHKL